MNFNIFDKFVISENEKIFLLNWIFNNDYKFILNDKGPNRKFYSFDNDKDVPSLFYEVRDRIIKKEKIKKWIPEPFLGNYVGWIANSGFIHKHMDPNTDDGCHVRYNLFLSVPNKGGEPVYNGKIFSIKEKEYIRCNSGTEMHECKQVIGNKPRIVVSYGFILPKL